MANPEDPIGMQGDVVTVISSAITSGQGEERTIPDLSGIATPTTPSESDSGRSDIDGMERAWVHAAQPSSETREQVTPPREQRLPPRPSVLTCRVGNLHD